MLRLEGSMLLWRLNTPTGFGDPAKGLENVAERSGPGGSGSRWAPLSASDAAAEDGRLRAPGRRLAVLQEALSRIVAVASPTPAETVEPDEALGRSVAVRWRRAPPFRLGPTARWTATRCEARSWVASPPPVPRPPLRLPVAGRAYPGSAPLRTCRRALPVRIMTGGPLPDGFDTVIRVEHTDGEEAGEGFVVVHATSDLGRHVRAAGQDMEAGSETVPVGTVVHSGALPVLLASGCTRVSVFGDPGWACSPAATSLRDSTASTRWSPGGRCRTPTEG